MMLEPVEQKEMTLEEKIAAKQQEFNQACCDLGFMQYEVDVRQGKITEQLVKMRNINQDGAKLKNQQMKEQSNVEAIRSETVVS